MAFFPLSGITGCIFPTTGITSGYDIQYNYDKITSFFKRDVFIGTNMVYMVVCTIENHTQIFEFLDQSDRDTFYLTIT